MIEVYEDPAGFNYQTIYNYDVLDNLVKVTQGSQERFFMYDSLKRLIRARDPEQATLATLNLSDPLTGNSAWSLGYQYDANGNLAGLRIVTDPQASPQDRKQAYTLTNFFKARYGNDGWECTNTPPAPGESPVGTLYINQRCTKLVKGDMRAVLETRFLRKPGQAEFSGSGKLTVGQFESSTRLELSRSDVRAD